MAQNTGTIFRSGTGALCARFTVGRRASGLRFAVKLATNDEAQARSLTTRIAEWATRLRHAGYACDCGYLGPEGHRCRIVNLLRRVVSGELDDVGAEAEVRRLEKRKR